MNENTVPQTAGTFLDRGMMFAARGEFQMAIRDFDEAIRINPNLAAAYILRGMALTASVSHVTGMDDNFTNVTTLARQAVTEEQVHVLNLAIADFTLVIRLEPNYAGAYNNRGLAHRDGGNLDLAIADFNQAIRLDPNYASAYSNRGIAHFDRGNLDLALADHDHAIRLDPNYVPAYSNRGTVHRVRGNLDLAIADYNHAIRLDPNDAKAYYNRGVVYLVRGT